MPFWQARARMVNGAVWYLGVEADDGDSAFWFALSRMAPIDPHILTVTLLDPPPRPIPPGSPGESASAASSG